MVGAWEDSIGIRNGHRTSFRKHQVARMYLLTGIQIPYVGMVGYQQLFVNLDIDTTIENSNLYFGQIGAEPLKFMANLSKFGNEYGFHCVYIDKCRKM